MVQRTADDRDAALDRLRLELDSRTAEHARMINDRADAQAILPSHEDVQVTPSAPFAHDPDPLFHHKSTL